MYLQKESEKKEKTYNADVKRKSNLRFQNFYIRLCLVPVKYFLENIYFPKMLFSGKKNVFKLFGCLKIHLTKNQFRCLVCSNIFTENALHSQATQFSIHFLSCKHIDNESIPHSFTKETKPSKKRKSNPVKLRSRGGGEGEIGGKVEWRRDQSGEIERRGAAIDDRHGAIVGLELGLWSPAKSLLPLSLRSGLSLSLSLSLSLLVR